MPSALSPVVLLVDDRPENLLALRAVLAPLAGELGVELAEAHSADDALRCVLAQGDALAVVLLDVQMPGTDGIETARLIRGRARTGHMPVIFVTAHDADARAVAAGYAAGAVDYLFKPLAEHAVRAKVRTFVELFRHREAAREAAAVAAREHAEREASEATLRDEAALVDTMQRIGTALASELDLDRLVQSVTDEATALTGAQFGAFFYNVEDPARGGEAYTLYTLSGVSREHFAQFPHPRATPVFGPTFRGERVVRSADITADPAYGRMPPYHGMPAGHLPVRSYLAVPVRSRAGAVLGGLFFGHAEPGIFGERDERLVVGIAGWAAVAMDNARLYASERRVRAEAEGASEQLQEQALELELTNQQLQDNAAELEMQAGELQATSVQLEERTEAAEAAERQLQAVFAQAPASVAVTVGPEHRFVLANARFEAMVGRPVRVRQTFAEALPDIAAQGYAKLLDEVYATGVPYAAHEAYARFDKGKGEPEDGWYDFVYQPLVDGAGRVTGIMQFGVEVTAQVHARQAVAQSEAQLRTLADAIPTLAWTARADGFIDWYNARWYEYTGTTASQMAGWGWQSVHDPAVLPHVMERWQASIATGEPFEMTFPLRGVDGRFRRFLTRVTPLEDSEGRVVRWFGTNTDVEAERLAREAAEMANQAKTDFLATMSHELRTPLNAIAGYAELLEIGVHGPVTDAQRQAISRIQRSQRHLLGLINDVLNFAKLEAGHVEFDLADVCVHDEIDALEPLVAPQLQARSLRFTREQCAGGHVVRADRDKLRQILVNLLSNAIKFTAPGGAIAMVCEERDASVSIAVRDTGIGIAAERLEHVFAPFVQIDRRLNAPHEGTGLGLAISRDLARGMGGDLTVASSVGVGSTFTLTLPRT